MVDSIRSADLLVKNILSDPNELQAIQANPQQALPAAAATAVAATPLTGDKWVYRIVVISLGLTTLAVVIGCIIIAMASISASPAKDLPSGLVALGSAAVGALAGLLAPPPRA